jgi:hypothetical protein
MLLVLSVQMAVSALVEVLSDTAIVRSLLAKVTDS